MKQTSSLTRKLTAAQDNHTRVQDVEWFTNANRTTAVVYRLYTEDLPNQNLKELTARYFQGFSILSAFGYYAGTAEEGAVIEVIGTPTDLQSIVHLAGDIRQVNNQSSVLVTWNNVPLLNVTGD